MVFLRYIAKNLFILLIIFNSAKLAFSMERSSLPIESGAGIQPQDYPNPELLQEQEAPPQQPIYNQVNKPLYSANLAQNVLNQSKLRQKPNLAKKYLLNSSIMTHASVMRHINQTRVGHFIQTKQARESIAAGDQKSNYIHWIGIFAGTQDISGSPNYKDSFSGIALGIEKNISHKALIGFSFTHFRSSTTDRSNQNMIEQNTNILSTYSIIKLDKVILNGSIYLGNGSTKSNETEKINSALYGAHGLLGYQHIYQKHSWMPYVAIQCSYMNQTPYFKNTNLDSKGYALKPEVGLDYFWRNPSEKGFITPGIKISVAQDILHHRTPKIHNTFDNNKQTISPSYAKGWHFAVSPSLKFENPFFKGQLSYTFEKSKYNVRHVGSAKFTIDF